MKRRNFIKLSVIGAAILMVPSQVWADQKPQYEKMLVLVELEGGNDGLNTVIPYSDDLYYTLRPKLAVDEDDVLKINSEIGLHPKLSSLHKLFEDEDVAIIQGVGYPNPNRSHFRSKDILNSASDADVIISDGWVKQAFEAAMPSSTLFADSVTMGNDDVKPFQGEAMRNVTLESAEDFLSKAGSIQNVNVPELDSLRHIAEVQNTVSNSYNILDEAMQESKTLETEFPQTSLGKKFQNLSELLLHGIHIPVFKVSLGGFDTHTNQTQTHEALLQELDEALYAFSQALKEMDLWKEVTTVTYCEFGRRAAENGSVGTDHGTAAPHFMIGGAVRGGLFGSHPSLNSLDDNGDLIFNTDFRSIYRSIIASWWKIDSEYLSEFETLELFV